MTAALFDLRPAPTPAPAPTTSTATCRVAGIDVSLTGTGIATTGGTLLIPTTGKRADNLVTRHRRLAGIARTVLEAVGHVDLAVIEGPSHHSIGGSTWDRGGLWWLIIDGLLDREIPVATVPPTCRAKYATGNGAARKTAVLEAARTRYGQPYPNDNEADAAILRAMGLDRLGQPLAAVPAGHRVALNGCEWPDLGAAA